MTALNETRRERESRGTHPGRRIYQVKEHIATSDERRGYSRKYDRPFVYSLLNQNHVQLFSVPCSFLRSAAYITGSGVMQLLLPFLRRQGQNITSGFSPTLPPLHPPPLPQTQQHSNTLSLLIKPKVCALLILPYFIAGNWRVRQCFRTYQSSPPAHARTSLLPNHSLLHFRIQITCT